MLSTLRPPGDNCRDPDRVGPNPRSVVLFVSFDDDAAETFKAQRPSFSLANWSHHATYAVVQNIIFFLGEVAMFLNLMLLILICACWVHVMSLDIIRERSKFQRAVTRPSARVCISRWSAVLFSAGSMGQNGLGMVCARASNLSCLSSDNSTWWPGEGAWQSSGWSVEWPALSLSVPGRCPLLDKAPGKDRSASQVRILSVHVVWIILHCAHSPRLFRASRVPLLPMGQIFDFWIRPAKLSPSIQASWTGQHCLVLICSEIGMCRVAHEETLSSLCPSIKVTDCLPIPSAWTWHLSVGGWIRTMRDAGLQQRGVCHFVVVRN